MKKELFLVTLFVLLFFSCAFPNRDNHFVLKWDEAFCSVSLNGEPLSGGRFSTQYNENLDNLEIITETREDLGWFFDHYTFYVGAFPHGGYITKEENPFSFEVDEYYRDCTVQLETFSLEGYRRAQDQSSLFMRISCPGYEEDNRFFQYDFNNNNTLNERNADQYDNDGVESFDSSIEGDTLNITILFDSGATQSFPIPGNWSDYPDYNLSPDNSSLLVETDIYDNELQEREYGYYIWDIEEEQLTSIPYEQRARACWGKASDTLYFRRYQSRSDDPEYYQTDWVDLYIDQYDLNTGEVQNLLTSLDNSGGHADIDLYGDCYLFTAWNDSREVRDYNGDVLFSFDFTTLEDFWGYRILFFQKETQSLIIWRDGYGLYQYGNSHQFNLLVDYSMIK